MKPLTRFAFIIHPLTVRDAARKYPIARLFPESWIAAFLRRKRPFVTNAVTGVKSITGATTEGMFLACPLTPKMMTEEMPLEQVYDEICECTEIAAREGAKLIGLGAFTSVVGDGGLTIAKRSPIAVTTGNSYTVATAIEGALKAADMVGIVTEEATLAVVGATGSIGRTCTKVLAPRFRRCFVVGRDAERTEALANEVGGEAATDVEVLRQADVVISVTSSDSAIVQPEHLKTGSIVCDVARPRDVSVRVAKERPDVLVIEGGVVKVPGTPDFGLNFGFPPGTAYACMSETMMLALEDRPESYTLGKDVSVEQVQEMIGLARKHGFELAGFRSFERAVDGATIERVRRARAKSLGTA